MLLKTQRNQLFQELIKIGLQPADFTETSGGGWYHMDCLKVSSALRFWVKQVKSIEGEGALEYLITCRPSRNNAPDTLSNEQVFAWNNGHYGVLPSFRNWANAVKREIDSPDLWLEATKAVHLFESAADPSADKFTIAEIGALHGQLRMLGQLFENSELLQECQTELAELTQTAAVKAETFSKKDWQNWAKGAFGSAIGALELNEAQAQELLALVRLAFGGLFLKQ